jgi:hypothetical protein
MMTGCKEAHATQVADRCTEMTFDRFHRIYLLFHDPPFDGMRACVMIWHALEKRSQYDQQAASIRPIKANLRQQVQQTDGIFAP